MFSFSRIRNSCILTAIVMVVGSFIDALVDMGWEDILMSSYFVFGTLFLMYIFAPIILQLLGIDE